MYACARLCMHACNLLGLANLALEHLPDKSRTMPIHENSDKNNLRICGWLVRTLTSLWQNSNTMFGTWILKVGSNITTPHHYAPNHSDAMHGRSCEFAPIGQDCPARQRVTAGAHPAPADSLRASSEGTPDALLERKP